MVSISPDPGGLLRSPKEYPANGVEPPRIFLFRRDPINAQDYKNFKIRDMWINNSTDDVWMLTSKTATSGTWTKLSTGTTGGIETLTGDSGGAVSANASANVNILGGTGVTVTGNPGTFTMTIDVEASGLTWTTDGGPGPYNVSPGDGRIANGGSTITYNLPTNCAVGDGFSFIDLSGNGFIIQCQGTNQIRMGNQISSVAGTIESTGIGDVVEIMCVVASSTYFAVDSIGNFTVT